LAVNLQSIATRAGVHASLVSRVLRGDPNGRISGEKRALILAIAQEIGYRPNRLASSLRTRRTRILAMIIPDVTNAFHSVLFRAVEETASERDYSVILCNTNHDDAKFRRVVSVLSEGHVDGLIIASSKREDREVDGLRKLDLPYVLLNRSRPNLADPWFGPDDLQTGRLGAQHLAALGHKNIALLVGDRTIDNMHRRIEGFYAGLREAGRSADDVLVLADLEQPEQALDRVTAALPEFHRRNITAVFALSTLTSQGAYTALTAAGLRIPSAMSLLGYSVSQSPDLTSVRPPAEEMARLATEYLMARLEKSDVADGQIQTTLPVKLVDRNTTGAPAAGGPPHSRLT
jgi:LacI family transcriptional regulator